MAGVGTSAQKPAFLYPLPTSTPSHPAFSLSLLVTHSCNVSCPSGFHGNNCSAPCECPEGPCHPVSGACQLGKVERRVQGTVTQERLALSMGSRSASFAGESEPTSETFLMPEICMDALGSP